MLELIMYHLDMEKYYRTLAKEYWSYGNDHMAVYADMKAEKHYNMAMTYWDREYWSKKTA